MNRTDCWASSCLRDGIVVETEIEGIDRWRLKPTTHFGLAPGVTVQVLVRKCDPLCWDASYLTVSEAAAKVLSPESRNRLYFKRN